MPQISTDKTYLTRILTNIITNAIQSMPKGGILTINAYYSLDHAIIWVMDTGEGIPENIKPNLFKPLFTTKSKGQGFGLAVTKRLIDALQGTIVFDSERGKGTKFIIEIPDATKDRQHKTT